MGRLPPPVYADGLRKQSQVKFYGYEALGTEGAIRDMKNMTSDYWPEMAVRDKRAVVRTVSDPGGMTAWDELIWAEGTAFHYGDKTVAGLLQSGVDHVFAVLGDYVTIWPEKKYYDTVTGESGSLEASVTSAAGGAAFRSKTSPDGLSDEANCLDLGKTAEGIFRPGDAVTLSGCATYPKNNQTLIVREVAGTCLYFYDNTFESPTEYAYILRDSDMGIPGSWTMAAYTPYGWNMLEFVKSEPPFGPFYFDFTQTIPSGSRLVMTWQDPAEWGIIVMPIITVTTPGGTTWSVTGYYSSEVTPDVTISFAETPVDYTEPRAVTAARTVPDLDHVFVHENRLFGYKGDTIYASKWGDVFNWNVYDGLASDSWTTETGTPGSFTGGISYGGYVRLFKEDHIFVLYGDNPGEYSLQSQEQIGVAKGSEKSLVAANGRLYYLSPKGPCVYAGGAPQLIADAFGLTIYKNGVAGTDGVKYYLSMAEEDGTYHLFVYDTRKGLWIREDRLRAVSIVKYDNRAWCLDSAGRMMILGPAGSLPDGAEAEDDVEWFAEFGDIMDKSPDRKRLAKLQIRLEMEEGAYVEVLLRYDSEQAWFVAAGIPAGQKRSVTLPIIPRRVDHFRLKIQGRGGCRIGSITRQVAAGSDR